MNDRFKFLGWISKHEEVTEFGLCDDIIGYICSDEHTEPLS